MTDDKLEHTQTDPEDVDELEASERRDEDDETPDFELHGGGGFWRPD